MLVGLVVAIQRGAWVVAVVWLVLLAGALITWARDLRQAERSVDSA
jgi:hypothetical protein